MTGELEELIRGSDELLGKIRTGRPRTELAADIDRLRALSQQIAADHLPNMSGRARRRVVEAFDHLDTLETIIKGT